MEAKINAQDSVLVGVHRDFTRGKKLFWFGRWAEESVSVGLCGGSVEGGRGGRG